MLYYNFDGYLGFQSRFGIVEHGNGEKSRKNKILPDRFTLPDIFCIIQTVPKQKSKETET